MQFWDEHTEHSCVSARAHQTETRSLRAERAIKADIEFFLFDVRSAVVFPFFL